MRCRLDTGKIYIHDAVPEEQALARTGHLCFAVHQDDIEIMAAALILQCVQQEVE